MQAPRIGFIGAGNMAASLIGGLIAKGFTPATLAASDPNQNTLQTLADQHGINACTDNAAVVLCSDILVLAVKPQVLKTVLTDMAGIVMERRPLIISIAAGISIASICEWLGGNLPVVRCMPNTPALLQLGASGMYANNAVNDAQRQQTETILRAVGLALWLDTEQQIDAVTAVSGSGPAYFFLLMEAMIAAGEQLGLSQDVARALTLQTAEGAAKMAMTSDVDVAELRRRVTSPGGTTEQAIQYFEKHQFKDTVNGALKAAAHRSHELSKT
jgi:pyrroline-5-carboxylate reductase